MTDSLPDRTGPADPDAIPYVVLRGGVPASPENYPDSFVAENWRDACNLVAARYRLPGADDADRLFRTSLVSAGIVDPAMRRLVAGWLRQPFTILLCVAPLVGIAALAGRLFTDLSPLWMVGLLTFSVVEFALALLLRPDEDTPTAGTPTQTIGELTAAVHRLWPRERVLEWLDCRDREFLARLNQERHAGRQV